MFTSCQMTPCFQKTRLCLKEKKKKINVSVLFILDEIGKKENRPVFIRSKISELRVWNRSFHTDNKEVLLSVWVRSGIPWQSSG